MAVLGIEMTDKEPVYGWESVKPTHHHHNELMDYSVRAYKLASKMVDTGEAQDEIDLMNDLGKKLQEMALAGEECTCRPSPDDRYSLCNVCKAITTLFYVEEAYPWA